MLLRFLIYSLMVKYMAWKWVNLGGVELYWTLFHAVEQELPTCGSQAVFFPQCAQIQTLLHSWQLLICGYPRDGSYKVCVYLLLLSQDVICCSQHGPPFVCKCVRLKITTLPIARKREKSSKIVAKSPGQLSTTCLARLGSSSGVECGWGWM